MYNRYREFAKAMGLTDYAVANAAGISKAAISDWKRGKHHLSLGCRYKISLVLHTDVDFTHKLTEEEKKKIS